MTRLSERENFSLLIAMLILIKYDDTCSLGVKLKLAYPFGKEHASTGKVLWLLVIEQTRYYLLPFRREISSLYSSSKSSSSSSSSSSKSSSSTTSSAINSSSSSRIDLSARLLPKPDSPRVGESKL